MTQWWPSLAFWGVSGSLQSLELAHVLGRLCCLSLFPIQAGQAKVSLGRERTVLLNVQQVYPGFFRSRDVAI